jgi:hypothetical protein
VRGCGGVCLSEGLVLVLSCGLRQQVCEQACLISFLMLLVEWEGGDSRLKARRGCGVSRGSTSSEGPTIADVALSRS